MTLIMIEGFEARALKAGWYSQLTSFVAGRFGGYACTNGGTTTYSLPAATDVIVAGFALQVPSGARGIFRAYDAASANPQWSVSFRADRYIDIARSGTSPVIASSSAPIGTGGEWVYMEIKGRINDVTGFVEVRVNGVVVASYTGDTAASSGGSGTTMVAYETASAMAFDDIYLLDDTGAAPYNDYLGEIQVETLTPNGNGVTNQFVGTDGNSVDNYLLVDELPAVDADHTWSSTSGERDLYTFTDPNVALGTILAVQSNLAVSKILPGPATVKVVERTAAGVVRVGAAQTVTNLLYRCELSTQDPAGAAWLPATVAGLQAGAEVG